ncbi:hypothetical protein A3Q56_02782 [Intoshia linei]|uniref:Uncharacterized protein n=1 Tax=Intoshia linei TaxID=1819745 RepID=A0A177B5B3_9BILA|nr:hypothetical protein A3Q56_02782 [Intoshia linei]
MDFSSPLCAFRGPNGKYEYVEIATPQLEDPIKPYKENPEQSKISMMTTKSKTNTIPTLGASIYKSFTQHTYSGMDLVKCFLLRYLPELKFRLDVQHLGQMTLGRGPDDDIFNNGRQISKLISYSMSPGGTGHSNVNKK